MDASYEVAQRIILRRLTSLRHSEKRLRLEIAQKRGLRTSFGSAPASLSKTHKANSTRSTPLVGLGSFDMEWVDEYVDFWEAMGRPGIGWTD